MGVSLSEGASQHHFDRRPRLCLPHLSYFSLPPRLTFSADEIVANPLLLNNFTIIYLRGILTVLALGPGRAGGIGVRGPPGPQSSSGIRTVTTGSPWSPGPHRAL